MIKLNRVSKVYPDGTQAVKDISFEVEEGELCVLLGPSGCGKTTTMKMINRLIPITEGEIYIDGRKNTELNEDELRRNIGYAIQDIGLFPHMTVQQNIETVPVLKSWPKTERSKRAEELLELKNPGGSPGGTYEVLKVEGNPQPQHPGEIAGVVVLEAADRSVLPATANDQRFEQWLRLVSGIKNAHTLGRGLNTHRRGRRGRPRTPPAPGPPRPRPGSHAAEPFRPPL